MVNWLKKYSLQLPDLLLEANKVRQLHKNNRVELCSIVNARSGSCPEDCKFCAQSGRHKAKIDIYPLVGVEEILKAAGKARGNKATCFGIVTSGRAIKDIRDIKTICRAVGRIKKLFPAMKCSVSLGSVEIKAMKELKMAGADRFHHNLETSENFFPRICTTHTYKERLRTIEAAKKTGFSVCSGALFGLGEKRRDRVSLALLLRDMEIESVPLNFLHPIKGTPLEGARPMPPHEILRTIAIFRLILPKADIKICGGRAVNLRGLQPLIFMAGASGMMVGNYLTQPGQDPALDLQMIKDLGLRTG
jgi:biotin synthase